jgi:DNA polymerase
MAANYGMRRAQLHGLYPNVWGAADEEAREKAVKRWEKNMKSRDRRKTDVLSREAWLACSLIVSGWRASNPATEKAWAALESAMREAVRNPGQKVVALGKVTYLVTQGSLWLRLPSGRPISYPSPKLRDQVWARLKLKDGSWGESEVVEREEAERLELKGDAKIEGKTSAKVTALGWDSTIQRMVRYGLYGGLNMENCALGAESDILRRAMKKCEANNYPIVMHCYDEAVAELPRGQGSVEEMSKLMLDLEPWTAGLPLTCHGEKSFRYKK